MPLDTMDAGLEQGARNVNEALTHRGGSQPIPDQSRAQRRTSYDPADFPLPNGREEEWRFTPIRSLNPLLVGGAPTGGLTVSEELPAGVALDPVTSDDPMRAQVPPPGDRAAALAYALSNGAARIVVPAEAQPDGPIILRMAGREGTSYQHLLVDVRQHASATVIVDHTGKADLDQLVSVRVGDGATLVLVSIQSWDDGSLHLGQHDVIVGRDATVRHIVVTLGGSVVRLNVNTTYAGPGGSFEGLGVYFADAGQHLEHRLFVDHEAPRCTSKVTYKGALQGATAHTVWVGDVLIRAAATGTDTYELNRNLVLTEGARADSVPNLEIETGDIVGAGHAAATGRFDDEQLFYLQSRGIPEEDARRLIVRAFFAEIIERIGIAQVTEPLMAAIDEELAKVMPEVTPA